jgi:hypothetical protein
MIEGKRFLSSFFHKNPKTKKEGKRKKEKAFSLEAQPTTTTTTTLKSSIGLFCKPLRRANEEELWKLKYYFTTQKL